MGNSRADPCRFPSPCGVMVAKELSPLNRNEVHARFPSPCGVMVAKEKVKLINEKFSEMVSVPLRGNGCERILLPKLSQIVI